MNFPPGYALRVGFYDSRTGRIMHMEDSGRARRNVNYGHNNRSAHGVFPREGRGGTENRGVGLRGSISMGTGGIRDGFSAFPRMEPATIQDIGNMGGRMGGGGGRVIINGWDVTDSMRRAGGYGGGLPVGFPTGPGLGTWTGGWGGHSGYPTTRPVDPHLGFVPGGGHGSPGHSPNRTYPGAPIDPLEDARGIISRKLRDAPETVKKEDLPEDSKDCSICYTPFWEKPEAGETEAPVKLRSCGHVFGESCLNEWVQTNNSCPSCRKEFPVVKAR